LLKPVAALAPIVGLPPILRLPPLTGTERTQAFALLATILTLGAMTASMIGVHLLGFLQARGLGLAAAVALGAGRPLALFGPDGYASLMGKLAMPSLLAQALSPSLGAILIEWNGPGAALGVLAGMTCLNIALVGLPWVTVRRG
jgi:hypothetical protein